MKNCVAQSVRYFVARWRSKSGCRIVLAMRARTKLVLCVNDFPVRVYKIPIADARAIAPIDYPVPRCVRKMLAFGKHGNMTKAARKMLREALA